MKATLKYIAAAAFAAVAVSACDDNFETPPVIMPPAIEVEATTTLPEFKSQFWSAMSAPTTIPYGETGDTLIFKGRVCSSDATGNIFKNIVVQSRDEKGNQVAMTFSVNSYDIYQLLPFGQEVAVYASDLQIGGYHNLLQFGAISGTEMTFMDLDVFTSHVVRTGKPLPEPALVDTTVATIAHVMECKADNDSLLMWQSRLVRFENVSFEDAGEPFAGAQTANRYITDADGKRLNVRNSSYSDFKNETLPYGNGSVTGILSYYNNDWQLMLIDAEGCQDFDGTAPEPDPDAPDETPAGEGTLESPYNAAKALEIASALKDGEEKEAFVEGVIVKISEISTSFGNASYQIAAGTSAKTSFSIYRGYGLNGEKFTSEDAIKVGDKVVVSGKLVNFKGNTPQMTQGSKIVSLNGGGSGDTPTTPGAPEGDGTAASPYNVAKALQVASALSDSESVEAFAQGIVSEVVEISTSFGNATYRIADAEGGTSLQVYRGYWLNGDKFTSEDQLKVGDKVVISGKLVNFMGNTPQFTTGSKVVSVNGAGGGDTPSTPDTNALFSSLDESSQTLPEGWTFENVNLGGLENVWTWKIYNEKGYLNASAFVNQTAVATEAYAVSPVIDLSGATGCSFTFDHAAKFQTTLRSLCGIAVREAGAKEWTALAVPVWPEAGAWTFVNAGTVDISKYNGKKVQIAFKYASSADGADTWEIKNLKVNGKK